MQLEESVAMFGFGRSFAAWSSGVADGYISFTVSPTHEHELIVIACITGKSDAQNGTIEVFNSSSVNGMDDIYTTIVGSIAFALGIGDDLRGASGSSVVIRLNCAAAGSIGIIGNRRAPSAYERGSSSW